MGCCGCLGVVGVRVSMPCKPAGGQMREFFQRCFSAERLERVIGQIEQALGKMRPISTTSEFGGSGLKSRLQERSRQRTINSVQRRVRLNAGGARMFVPFSFREQKDKR